MLPETWITRTSSRPRHRGPHARSRLLAARLSPVRERVRRGGPGSDRHSRRAIAQIVRNGEPIAAINHDPALVEPSGSVQAIGPAARVAIDNERLQAELLDQLAALQSSQVRIVQTSDAERRLLERNLHDAAQQAVLELSYDIRLAMAAAHGQEAPTASIVGASMTGVQYAVESCSKSLRHLSRCATDWVSSRPLPALAIQHRSGSRSAVSERTATAVVERTAYLAAADVIDQAVSAGADALTIAAEAADGDLVVEIRGTDVRPTTPMTDRVGALGGQIIRTSGPSG